MGSMLDKRLRKVEAKQDIGVPLYIREWLGEALTADERVRAAAEWAEMQARPPADPSSFSREHREWLIGRGEAV